MKIIEISIKLGQTFNLGNYSNVRPEIELTADPDETDTLDQVLDDLTARARQFIHDEIDRALEDNGKPPQFYAGPRYGLLLAHHEKVAVLVPADIDRDADWLAFWSMNFFDRRLETVLDLFATDYQTQYDLVDCRNGDLSKLPDLQRFKILTVEAGDDYRYLLLLNQTSYSGNLPGRWNKYWPTINSIRVYESLRDELQNRAQREGYQFIDCTDDDLTKLPDLPQKEPDHDLYDYEDEEDDDV